MELNESRLRTSRGSNAPAKDSRWPSPCVDVGLYDKWNSKEKTERTENYN